MTRHHEYTDLNQREQEKLSQRGEKVPENEQKYSRRKADAKKSIPHNLHLAQSVPELEQPLAREQVGEYRICHRSRGRCSRLGAVDA
jgi:hypothetical protein